MGIQLTEATVRPSGVSATTSVGAITPADVMGLTGVSATSTSIGTPTIDTGDVTADVQQVVSATTADWFIKYRNWSSFNRSFSNIDIFRTPLLQVADVHSFFNRSFCYDGYQNAAGIVVTSNPTVQPAGVSATSTMWEL